MKQKLEEANKVIERQGLGRKREISWNNATMVDSHSGQAEPQPEIPAKVAKIDGKLTENIDENAN